MNASDSHGNEWQGDDLPVSTMTSLTASVSAGSPNAEARVITVEPYYQPVGDEIGMFEADCLARKLP